MEYFNDYDDMIKKTAENIRNSNTGIFALMALMALNPEVAQKIIKETEKMDGTEECKH